jgi:tRNA 5-methylaminomethyl-2-thiouridine biosynthesis bifunctional protein
LLNVVAGLLQRGVDWDLSGVFQRQDDGRLEQHETAGWLRPARLVSALLATPGVTVEYGRRIDDIAALNSPLVVVAAGFETVQLLAPGFPLQPVAGQVAFGPVVGEPAAAAPFNGNGHFLPAVATENGDMWLAGASFERDVSSVEVPHEVRARHRHGNEQRLGELLPSLLPQLPSMFESASDWRGVRATSPDRLPIVGPWSANETSVWLCTALGARGMTLALLCADLLVARLHGEPLPIAPRLAEAVQAERMARRMAVETALTR